MKIRIMDYDRRRKTVDLGEGVTRIDIHISFGDELAYVFYADGTTRTFDSCDEKRTKDIIEDRYALWQEGMEWPNSRWSRRKDSYDGRRIMEAVNGKNRNPEP